MFHDIIQELKKPKVIHSRHEMKAHLTDMIEADEKFVFGIEKQDSLFNLYRTRWFLTETKVIFVTGHFPLKIQYDVFPFESILDIEYFEDEQVLVIEAPGERFGVEAESEEGRQFLTQVIEQYNRYQIVIENLDADENDTENTTEESTEATDEQDDSDSVE